MKLLIFLARIIVGAVFVFSGFVKAVDPLGSCYKFTDYFNLAFDMPYMAEWSLPLAFILSALEFTTGIMLVFNLKPRWAVWLAFMFEIVFTPLTLYIAIKNPVHDCGCFGDALVLDNWTTFAKNVVLLALVIFLVVKRKQMNNPLSDNVEIAIAASAFCVALIFQHIMIRHLPILDFRPYKIGNNIAELMEYPPDAPRDEYKTELIYTNSITGEEKTFDSENYPWNDSTWVWKDTKSVLVKQGYVPPVHDFTMTDTSGIDYTEQVLNYVKPVLLVVMHKLEKSEVEGLEMLHKLQEYAEKNNWAIIGMTSSNWDVVNNVKNEFNVEFPFVQTDDITLKTIVRANPGIVKLEKGTVMDKWNYRNFKFR